MLTLTNLAEKASIKIDIDIQGEGSQIIKQSQTQQFKLLKRQDDSEWEELDDFKYSAEESHYEYTDIIVDSDIRYDYAIKLIDTSIDNNIEEQAITASFDGCWLCNNKNVSFKVDYDNQYKSLVNKPELIAHYHSKEECELISKFLDVHTPKLLKGGAFGSMLVSVSEYSQSWNMKEGTFKLRCVEIGNAYDRKTLTASGFLKYI